MLIPIVPSFVPIVWTTSFLKTLTTDNNALAANFTIVEKILPSATNFDGTSGRIRIVAPSTGSMVMTASYIGPSSTTGNAWNFASTPTQITWDGGSSSKTITGAGTTYLSDVFVMPNMASAFTVAFNISSGSRFRYGSSVTPTNAFISYTKSGVSEAATVSKGSGYTAKSDQLNIVSELQVG